MHDLRCVFIVTVTEALVLRPLLEDQLHIKESVRILVPADTMKQKCFQIKTKQVRRSQQFQLRRLLFDNMWSHHKLHL